MEIMILLAVLAFVAIVVVCVLILPIAAFARSRHIPEIEKRLRRIEQQLAGLSSPLVTTPTPPDIPEVLPATTPERAQPQRPLSPVPPRPTATPILLPKMPQQPQVNVAGIEEWIGRRGLGWVAVVLILLATAFFLKAAFENEWVGELGRVAIGVAFGIGLCLTGQRFRNKGWRIFSQMLFAGGVVLLYLATFAAFGYYHLLPQDKAAIFLVILIVESAALAIVCESPAIALMAIIGGLLNPILLHTGHDRYQGLFSYLALLNAGVIGLLLMRRWRVIGSVALIGTQLLFWAWYDTHYHPLKLNWAIGFQVVIFALYLLHPVLAHAFRRWPAREEDVIRYGINAFAFGWSAYALLDEDYHTWMGAGMLGMAVVHALVARLLVRKPSPDRLMVAVAISASMACVAMVFPLQAEAGWISVGWAAQGVVLWWAALRLRSDFPRVIALALFALAAGRVVFVDTPYAIRAPFVPIFNPYGLPASFVAICLVVAAFISRQFMNAARSFDRVAHILVTLAAVFIIWFILSNETYGYFLAQEGPRAGAYIDEIFRMRRTAQLSLSILWGAYAAVLLAIGFWRRNAMVRWLALGLFALTLAKLFFFDLSELPGLYRAGSFFVMAVVLGFAAWGYQKFKLTGLTAGREENQNAAE